MSSSELSGPPAARRGAMVALSCVALVAISYFWLASTYFGARSDIPSEELPGLILLAGVVLAVQCAALVVLRRFAIPLAALFGAVNTYSLYGALSPKISAMPLPMQGLILLSIGFLYFAALDQARNSRLIYRAVLFGAPLLLVALIGYRLAASEAGASNEAVATPAAAASDGQALPNIYFLSFDSLMPESLAQSILGIPRPPYLDVIDKHGGQMLPNTFASAVPTKRSLASVLMLQPTLADMDNIVSGFSPSPLRSYLKALGYETGFTFKLSFFGRTNGPHLDHYNIYSAYSLCDFVRSRRRIVGLFGYCTSSLLRPLAPPKAKRTQSYEDFSFELLKAVSEARNDPPQFYMEHVLTPNHTDSDYGGTAEEKARFVADYTREAEAAARMLDRALTQIRAADPTAIVVIYGDHGTFQTRQIKFEDAPAAFVQDQYGTVGAVINAERCIPFINAPTEGKFHTTAQIASGIAQCVAADHKAPLRNADFGRITQISETERFDRYVYEEPN